MCGKDPRGRQSRDTGRVGKIIPLVPNLPVAMQKAQLRAGAADSIECNRLVLPSDPPPV
jgi:hypothetical protein